MFKHVSFIEKFVVFVQKFCKHRSLFKNTHVLTYQIIQNLHPYKRVISPIAKLTLLSLKPIIPSESQPCPNNEQNLDIIIQMAEKALAEGQIQEAETILLVALKLAESNKMESAVCHIYDVLINISYSIGDFVNAQELIHQIIGRLLKTGMKEDDDTIVTFRLKLARLYGHTLNYDLANKTFQECIAIQQRKLDEGPIADKSGVLYVDLLFWYGVFLFQNDKFDEALRNVDAAYQFSNKIKGINSSQELVILTILTEILCALGDYDQAILHLTNAIIIGKNINHPELALSYTLLGNIYLQKQLYAEAKRWCEEGAKLALQQRNVRAQQASRACLEKIKQAFDTKYEHDQEHA